MYFSVEAVIKEGKLDLNKPIHLPDGTKATVTFLQEPATLGITQKNWFDSDYQKTFSWMKSLKKV